MTSEIGSPLVQSMGQWVRRAARSLARDSHEITQLQSSGSVARDFARRAVERVSSSLEAMATRGLPEAAYHGPLMMASLAKESIKPSLCFFAAPLVGMTNFEHGWSQFATALVLAERLPDPKNLGSEAWFPKAAVVEMPMLGCYFLMEKGHGCWFGDAQGHGGTSMRRLRVGGRSKRDHLLIHWEYSRPPRPQTEGSYAIRHLGVPLLGGLLVAQGLADGMVCNAATASVVDTMVLRLAMQETGGTVAFPLAASSEASVPVKRSPLVVSHAGLIETLSHLCHDGA
jgi:fructose-1,6-bisphosphatase/inositol monophosphatase family enzyme